MMVKKVGIEASPKYTPPPLAPKNSFYEVLSLRTEQDLKARGYKHSAIKDADGCTHHTITNVKGKTLSYATLD